MSGALRRLALAAPGLVLGQLDAAITLYGQTPAYWSGAHDLAVELSPTFRWLLTVAPVAFELGSLCWLATFALAVLLASEPFAAALAVAVALGHAIGITSWLVFRFEAYALVGVLVALAAGLLTASLRVSRGDHASAERYAFRGWPVHARNAITTGLLAVAAFLYLVPP